MTDITIQTWNCFGAGQTLRAALTFRGMVDAHRLEHPELRQGLAEPDIVCIQEIFLRDGEDFFDSLEQPYKTRDENRTTWWPPTVGGSGLGVASRLPFSTHTLRAFSRPHVGSERFARKGMLHVRVRGEGDSELDVLTTHMQSGYDTKARAVRERQLRELREAVDEMGSLDRAFVVCGDLNIDGLSERRDEEYSSLTKLLPDFVDLGAPQDTATFVPDPEVNELAHRFEATAPKQRVDYVLFRSARNGGPSALKCELVLQNRLSGHGPTTYASDHFALRATIRM